MNSLKTLSTGLCLFSLSQAFAVTPHLGPYAGLIIGGSYSPDITTLQINPLTHTETSTKLKYSMLGNIGGMLGYRFGQARAELEFIYNYAPYKSLEIEGITYRNVKETLGYRMKGSTSTAAGMLNGFYDFFSDGSETAFVPYLGLGIGYAYVKNNINFYLDNIEIPGTNFSRSANAPAVQGIVGASYFLDDYTSFSLDYRYLTTKKISTFDSKVITNSINLSFTGSIDCF